jgi:hypothetical protein
VLVAVRSSMPAFYKKNRTKLRSVSEGADTLLWLAVSSAALHHASGLFFQGLCAERGKKGYWDSRERNERLERRDSAIRIYSFKN